MTDINDVPQVNALYLEQQQVQAAMSYLNNGGTINNVTVSPPPYTPPAPGDPGVNPTPPAPMMMMMTVNILLKQPVSPDLIQEALDALVVRNDEISQELADLGVTGMGTREDR